MATIGRDYRKAKGRRNHTSHVIEGNLYMWGTGGDQEDLFRAKKKELKSCIKVLNLTKRIWQQHETSGKPPLAAYDYSSAVIGNDIYYFGGYSLYGGYHGGAGCYHNSLYKLNIENKSWSEVSPTTTDNGPMKKSGCGMAAIRIDNQDLLIVIGGEGPINDNTPHQHNALYEKSYTGRNNVYTNEIYYFDLSNDKWTSINSTGQCPPPCCRFTVTSINDNTIILFGGMNTNGRASSDVFIGTCSSSTINWEKISQPESEPLMKWPEGRWGHATTLLDEHSLLVVGGYHTSDSWIFNINIRTWEELTLPQSVTGRWFHSLNSSIASVIVVFGGSSSLYISDMTLVIELRCSDEDEEWSMCGVTRTYTSEKQKKEEQEQLQQVSTQPSQPAPVSKTPSLEYIGKHSHKKKKITKEEMQMKKIMDIHLEYVAERENEIGQLQQEKNQFQEEKDQLLQEKDQLQHEKDQLQHEKDKLQQEKDQLQQEKDQLQEEKDQLQQEKGQLQQEKDQLQQEKDQLQQEKDQLQYQLQQEKGQLQQEKGQLQEEKDQLRQEKDQLQYQLQQEKDQLQHQLSQHEGSWMITRDEIHITQEVIGKGGWGEVRVANFRGLRVAAKCLHDLIISHYNISIFNREMDIASKICHPNLLQFIGATQEGTPPIILCELMPTSLNHQLQTNPLTRLQFIRISQDVSCALNYLHLYRPHPILHRDVSSSNVLLQQLVSRVWKAKLSDYGSANLAHKISSNSAGPGSPVYSAPEAQFPDNHSPAMDVYSFGVLLMEMVLCQSPSSTTSERERQADTISWPSMKRLVKDCINRQSSNRPSIAVVLDHLKTL